MKRARLSYLQAEGHQSSHEMREDRKKGSFLKVSHACNWNKGLMPVAGIGGSFLKVVHAHCWHKGIISLGCESC